jgi:hypothetical protein
VRPAFWSRKRQRAITASWICANPPLICQTAASTDARHPVRWTSSPGLIVASTRPGKPFMRRRLLRTAKAEAQEGLPLTFISGARTASNMPDTRAMMAVSADMFRTLTLEPDRAAGHLVLAGPAGSGWRARWRTRHSLSRTISRRGSISRWKRPLKTFSRTDRSTSHCRPSSSMDLPQVANPWKVTSSFARCARWRRIRDTVLD